MPPPRVNPATPVVETSPPVTARPKACVSWSMSAQVRRPRRSRCRAPGRPRTAVIRDRSMTMPPSTVEKPGSEWPPPRTATSEVLAAREVDRAHDVGDARAADDERRAPVVGAVPDRARLVVRVVLGPDELAAQALLELGERRVAEGVGRGCCCCHVVALLGCAEVVGRGQPSRAGLSDLLAAASPSSQGPGQAPAVAERAQARDRGVDQLGRAGLVAVGEGQLGQRERRPRPRSGTGAARRPSRGRPRGARARPRAPRRRPRGGRG